MSSDQWPYRFVESTDDRLSRDSRDDGGTRYGDVRDDRGSPYYRGLRDLSDDRYAPDDLYALDDDEPHDRDALFDEPPSRRTVQHLLSALLCLVLTPIGIAAMTYGADRYWQLTLEQAGAERDLRGLLALGGGAVLLLIVACLGALSPAGPLLSGVIWGLVPAGLYLMYPRDTAQEVSDLPALPDFAVSGAVTWLGHAAFLMIGTLLIGAGLGAAIRRPRKA